MPTGTGGGHFSGGGSHSSGGGHFSGGNGGFGGHPARRGIRHGGPVFIYTIGGRDYYVGEKRRSLINMLAVFFVISIMAVVSCLGLRATYGEKVDIIKQDYINYQEIIVKAERDPSWIVEGVFVGQEYSQNAGKWCIKYQFTINGKTSNGHSFYTYTKEECEAMPQNIQIAVGNITSTGEYDSIEMTFKDKALVDDGEYVYFIGKEKIMKQWSALVGGISGALLIGTVTLSILSFKKDEKENAEKTLAEGSVKPETKKVKYCSYCGSEIKDDAKSCPYCGAGENKFSEK